VIIAILWVDVINSKQANISMTEASRLVKAVTSRRRQRNTTTTTTNPEEDALRSVKAFAKQDSQNVDDLYDAIIEGPFRSNQPEIRTRGLILCDYLFRRSVRFRTLCVENFRHDVARAVLGRDFDIKTIPGTKAKARALRIAAIRCVHEWYEKFGKKNAKLNLAYRWVRTRIPKLDFEQALSNNPDRLPRDPKKLREIQYAKWQNYEKIRDDMIEAERSIETALSGVTRCLGMLLSTLPVVSSSVSDEKKVEEEEDDEWEEVDVNQNNSTTTTTTTNKISNAEWAKEHGIHNALSYRLQVKVDVGTIHVDDSNEIILEELKDHEKTLRKHYLPKLVEWIRMLSSMNDPNEARKKELQSRLRSIVSLRTRVDETLKKCEKIVAVS
jgi:hypothetical protein